MASKSTATSRRSYRKKPVVIDAMQYDGTNSQAIVEAFGMQHGRDYAFTPSGGFLLRTLESNEFLVRVDDYVIRGVKGEHYACKPDIFAATYEDASGTRSETEATYPTNRWCAKPGDSICRMGCAGNQPCQYVPSAGEATCPPEVGITSPWNACAFRDTCARLVERERTRSSARPINASRHYLESMLAAFGPDEGVAFDQETWARIRDHVQSVLSATEETKK